MFGFQLFELSCPPVYVDDEVACIDLTLCLVACPDHGACPSVTFRSTWLTSLAVSAGVESSALSLKVILDVRRSYDLNRMHWAQVANRSDTERACTMTALSRTIAPMRATGKRSAQACRMSARRAENGLPGSVHDSHAPTASRHDRSAASTHRGLK